jgi:hypothetical protein
VWEEKKARQMRVNIPAGRIVGRVQVELTAVKMCVYESEEPAVNFTFAETNSNDPNPLTSVKLPDTCGCNICPENTDGTDWNASEKQWSDTKLDVHFEGGNSTLCIKTLTVKIQFASEISFITMYTYH